MIVILCHAGDAPALWLHDALIQLGRDEVKAVAVEELVYSRRIVHRLNDRGDRGEIALSRGRVLRAEDIAGAINRVRFLPLAHIARATPGDKAYATEELNAFLLAWLNSVAGRVINPALPLALDGSSFPAATVMHLAAMAGLPISPWRSDAPNVSPTDPATHAVIVFDGKLFGPLLPRPLQDGCRRLAVLLGVPLLQVALKHSPDRGWRFLDAHGAADFRIGGHALALGIAAAFENRVAPA